MPRPASSPPHSESLPARQADGRAAALNPRTAARMAEPHTVVVAAGVTRAPRAEWHANAEAGP